MKTDATWLNFATDRTISVTKEHWSMDKKGNSMVDRGISVMELVLSVSKEGNSVTDLVKSVTNKGISMSRASLSVMEKVKSFMELVLSVAQTGFLLNNECLFIANRDLSGRRRRKEKPTDKKLGPCGHEPCRVVSVRPFGRSVTVDGLVPSSPIRRMVLTRSRGLAW